MPFGLRPTVSAASAGALLGLAERVLAEAPTVWPWQWSLTWLAYISCLGTAPQARRP